MARPLRINYPGAFYHITSRGNERKPVFKSNIDREKFLEYLESATLRYKKEHRGQFFILDKKETKNIGVKRT